MIVAITEGSVVAIILGLLTLAGVFTTAWFGYLSTKLGRQVNKAVNDRPKGDPTVAEDVTELKDRVGGLEEGLSRVRETQAHMSGQLEVLINRKSD